MTKIHEDDDGPPQDDARLAPVLSLRARSAQLEAAADALMKANPRKREPKPLELPEPLPRGVPRVYFVHARGSHLIKVGWTTNYQKRVDSLQVGCPFALQLIGQIRGPQSKEQEIHEALTGYGFRGEWFWLGRFVADLIVESGGMIPDDATVIEPGEDHSVVTFISTNQTLHNRHGRNAMWPRKLGGRK